jgi:hypothetical protein
MSSYTAWAPRKRRSKKLWTNSRKTQEAMLGGIRVTRVDFRSAFTPSSKILPLTKHAIQASSCLTLQNRALHGSLGDLFRYSRLGRLGNQSGYVPHGTNTIDIDSVRKRSAAVLSRHLKYPLTLIRSVKSAGRTNNMERLELGEEQ